MPAVIDQKAGKNRQVPNEDRTSSRIEILRFPLIVGVVFIHNYATAVNQLEGPTGIMNDPAWVQFIRLFVSEGLATIAVPLFFVISGYLFFVGGWGWGKYTDKLHRRMHTLLIPYLFWNLLALAVFAAAQRIPSLRFAAFSTRFPPIHSFTPFDYVNAVFGLTSNYPISAQFWFIRDLMALLVLAQVIHFLLWRRLALPFIAVLFGLWFFKIWPLLWPSVDATFFFSLGAFLALPGKNLEYLDKFGTWICAAFLGLLILHSAFPEDTLYLGRLVIMVGVPCAWFLARLVAGSVKLKARMVALGGASFFVFAAHQPLLTILIRIVYKLLHPSGGLALLGLFFAVPVCLIVVLLLIHMLLMRGLPRFTGFITGSAYRTKRALA